MLNICALVILLCYTKSKHLAHVHCIYFNLCSLTCLFDEQVPSADQLYTSGENTQWVVHHQVASSWGQCPQ